MGKYPALVRASGELPAGAAFASLGRVAILVGVGLLVANCNGGNKISSKIDPKYGVSASPRVVAAGQPVPKGGGTYRVGKAYQVAGRTYVPNEDTKYKAEGLASWYGDDFHGRLTANGEVFDMHSIAAAHPTLPMPSYVRVTNLGNGNSMIVRVNDRGPYHGNRVIDVSQRAADLLGFKNRGTARVRVEYVGRAPLEGSDDVQLASSLRTNGAAPSNVMLASAGPLPALRAPANMPALRDAANVPVPPSRPFDLGDAPEAEQVAEAPAAVIAPVRVAGKPRPVPAASPMVAAAPVQKPRPVQVASAVPPPVRAPAPIVAAAPQRAKVSAEPQGWVVGPQPAMGYASAEGFTPVSTGRGLY